MVEAPCPGCRRPVKARDDQVGRKVRCSKCRTQFHVPADAREVPSLDRPRRPRRQNRLARVVLAVTLLALAAGVVGGAAYVIPRMRQPEAPVAAAAAEPQPAPKSDSPAAKTTGPGVDTPNPLKNPAPAAPKDTPAVAGPTGRPIAFRPPSASPEPVQTPAAAIGLDVPFAAALRLYPPAGPDADPYLLYEARPAFQGRGRRLAVGRFSRDGGAKLGGVEFDDDRPDPIVGVSADGGRVAHVAGDRLTVWELPAGTKLVDGLQVALHVRAVLFADPPTQVIAVDGQGGVEEWDIGTKKVAGRFGVPMSAAGRGVAAAPNRGVVLVAAGGKVWRVDRRKRLSEPAVPDVPGAGRSLALAASAGGKLAYLFETAGPGPETLVASLRPDGKHAYYRWPAEAGEPVSAGWCGEDVLAVGTATGNAVWFDAEGGGFRPLALVRAPAKSLHAAGDGHWSLLPNPGGAGRSLLVGHTMPPQGLIDPLDAAADRPAFTLRLDDKGLFR